MTPIETLKAVESFFHEFFYKTEPISQEDHIQKSAELYKIVKKTVEESKNLPPFGPGEVISKPFTFENQLNQREAIKGFIAFLTTKTIGITVASGHAPGNVDQLIHDFCNANKFPQLKSGWEKLLRFPE